MGNGIHRESYGTRYDDSQFCLQEEAKAIEYWFSEPFLLTDFS